MMAEQSRELSCDRDGIFSLAVHTPLTNLSSDGNGSKRWLIGTTIGSFEGFIGHSVPKLPKLSIIHSIFR